MGRKENESLKPKKEVGDEVRWNWMSRRCSEKMFPVWGGGRTGENHATKQKKKNQSLEWETVRNGHVLGRVSGLEKMAWSKEVWGGIKIAKLGRGSTQLYFAENILFLTLEREGQDGNCAITAGESHWHNIPFLCNAGKHRCKLALSLFIILSIPLIGVRAAAMKVSAQLKSCECPYGTALWNIF